MRQCMITYIVRSNFRRRLDNYEMKTGKRHRMQPKVASAGSKRTVNFGIDPLDDEYDEATGLYWTGIVATLHD